MQLNIDEIKVKKRVRKDLGDLTTLKDSMKRYGLLNPITVNSKHELVAGQRRLESAKELGWTSIPVKVLDINDRISQLEIELEENTQRSDFTDEELMAGYEELEKLRNPGFFKKLWNRIVSFFTLSNEKSVSRKAEKLRHSMKMSILCIAGIIIVITGAILTSKGIISEPVHFFMDFVSVAMMTVGLLFFVRWMFLKNHLD